MFTSALVTHGPRVLLVALIMTALCVGLVERQAGWRVGLAVFWGTHLFTVVAVTLILTLLDSSLQSRTTESLLVMRDVGPSAGYFGSLGFGLALAAGRASALGTAAVLVWLGLDAVGIIRPVLALPQEVSADLAHILAFSFGLILGRVRIPPNPEPDAPSEPEAG
jgi:hypothetical protein